MLLLIQYTLVFASVLSLVALGGCFSEHSGVINLGLEGIMVMGALGGGLALNLMPDTTNAFIIVIATILCASLVGLVYSCLLGVAAINFKADQTLIGTAMNMLATAFSVVVVRAKNTAANPNNVSNDLAYINTKQALIVRIGSFEFSWFMLVAVIALLLSAFVLYRTRFGLRLMACGENPQAADSVGINVYKLRWAGVLISGILGVINNVWCTVAATWLLGLFMGASSNFGLSSIVRYWRHEDFPAVYSGAPPLGTVIGAAMPFVVASIATSFGGYKYAFGFVAILAVICVICNRAFNPRGIIAYDNKLREAAGLPIDDELEQRLIREGHAKDKG